MAVEYNTVPEDSPLLVAEAPKKKTGGRVVAAAVAAALILATAVAGSTSVFRAASNLAKSSGKTTQLKLDTSNAGQWAPKQPMCISVEDRGKTVPATYYDFDLKETVWQICESGTGVVDKSGVLSCDPAEDTKKAATDEEKYALLREWYAASDLEAQYGTFPDEWGALWSWRGRDAVMDGFLHPTFNLRLEKCIDGKSRQLFTVHKGSIEHELPDGQIFCFNVDRDTNSVVLGSCSRLVPTCFAIGCAFFDLFDLHFTNMEPQVTFKMMPYESWNGGWKGPTGPKSPCMGALARTDAKGASLKAGKQYNAGAIRVVDCARDVLPQYQLTEWLQV